MAPMYYRGAQAALLVYDITSQESFVELHSWIEGNKKRLMLPTQSCLIWLYIELKRNMTDELVTVVVANKLDLVARREVPEDQAREYVMRVLGPETPLYEVSAKEDDGMTKSSNAYHFLRALRQVIGTIEDIFLHLTRVLVDRKQYSLPQNNKKRQPPINVEEPPVQSSSCCGFF